MPTKNMLLQDFTAGFYQLSVASHQVSAVHARAQRAETKLTTGN
jgi:hypothetical protein